MNNTSISYHFCPLCKSPIHFASDEDSIWRWRCYDCGSIFTIDEFEDIMSYDEIEERYLDEEDVYMCEIFGKLSIVYQNGDYIKGRAGHFSFFVPRKGGARMAAQVRAHNGEIVSGNTMRGMLVKLQTGGKK